jgi:hypothetical protein
MHRALCCTCSLKIPLLLFFLPPTSPNQFCGVTWPLLPSSPIYYLLLIVVIFHSPVFAKCWLSCLPICTSSVRTLSVNFLFVTPSCLCQKSVCWIGCCLVLPHIFRSPQILDGSKTAMRIFPQQWWWDCDVGASAISFNLAAQPPQQWEWQCVSNLLKFLTVARPWWQDCAAISSTTVARQQSACQHSPAVWRCNILDSGNVGTSEFFLNSWWQ